MEAVTTSAVWLDANIITWQIVWSSVVVFLMTKIKASDWPIFNFINDNSFRVNRILAVVMSGLVALGIHSHYSYATTDSGTVTLVLTGISWQSLLEHGRSWVFSYIVQQTTYKVSGIQAISGAKS